MQRPFNLKDRKAVSGLGLWPDQQETQEVPAMPKESTYSGIAGTHPGWQNAFPQTPQHKEQWLAAQREPRKPISFEAVDFSKIDFEKLAGRMLFIAMGLFTLVVSVILLGKVVWMVWTLK